MAMIQFTRNHTDHSSDNGFQFEFFCDKCGNGHMSQFVANKVGMAASVLSAVGSIFGGRAANAGWAANQAKDMFRGKARDDAFAKAIAEGRQHFKQCSRCGKWVCPDVCWNAQRNLCEECAPDLAEEAASAQAQAAKEQVNEKARTVDQVAEVDMKRLQIAACPHCNAHVEGSSKFCSSCGKPLAAGKAACAKCGTEYSGKFCPECGTPRA